MKRCYCTGLNLQFEEPQMTEPKMTPDELAMHLSDIAKTHGMALTEIEFQTYTGAAVGTHSYSEIKAYRMDHPYTILSARQ